jgi:hypothetical protein
LFFIDIRLCRQPRETAAVFISGGTMKAKHYWDRLILDDFDESIKYGKNGDYSCQDRSEKRRQKQTGRVIYDTQDFKCRNCGFFVTANRELSGVNNRNHCPRCLWSRHMDITPGDRRSDCLSRMEPAGLSVKQVIKKYGSANGELMVIHFCTGCEKVSINRIAADDDPHVLLGIYEASLNLPVDLSRRLNKDNIRILQLGDREIVQTQLFGVTDYSL